MPTFVTYSLNPPLSSRIHPPPLHPPLPNQMRTHQQDRPRKLPSPGLPTPPPPLGTSRVTSCSLSKTATSSAPPPSTLAGQLSEFTILDHLSQTWYSPEPCEWLFCPVDATLGLPATVLPAAVPPRPGCLPPLTLPSCQRPPHRAGPGYCNLGWDSPLLQGGPGPFGPATQVVRMTWSPIFPGSLLGPASAGAI